VPEFGGVGTSASSSGSSRAARRWTFIRTKVPRGKGENPNRKELWVTSDEVVESHGDCFGARVSMAIGTGPLTASRTAQPWPTELPSGGQ
jgi:hypothetical protein